MAPMKTGSQPVDLIMETGAEHSVVTQPVGPLSQKHATIIGVTGNQACCPLVSRQCNLGSQEVRHEFLYLPNYLVALMGRDLLCKLRAQITFDSDGMVALKLRGPEAKALTLMVKQEEEWQLYAPEERSPEIPELPLKIPSVWDEDNSLGWPEMCPH
jgi:hypothetical protein